MKNQKQTKGKEFGQQKHEMYDIHCNNKNNVKGTTKVECVFAARITRTHGQYFSACNSRIK